MNEERKPPWEEKWNLNGGMWSMWPPENPTDEYRTHNAARMQLGRHSDDCELNALLKRARGEV